MTLPYIQTSSGTFSLTAPDPDDVVLADVARALSHLCRFTGHTEEFYSVAQHSVLAARIAQERGLNEQQQREALLHDAHEAYVGDMATPLARLCPEYKKFSRLAREAVALRFCTARRVCEAVKKIDAALLLREVEVLVGDRLGDDWPEGEPADVVITPWNPPWARRAFLKECQRLGVY